MIQNKYSSLLKISLALSLMLSIPLQTLLYRFLNNSHQVVHSLVTSIDNGIPFSKIFILPYIGFYPFIFFVLCYLCFKDMKTYLITIVAINISYLICFFIYHVFQTTVPRPFLNDHGFLSNLVLMIYRSDNPYNTFPSIHVLTSYLAIKAINRCPSKSKMLTLSTHLMAFLIIISTQLVKQHVLFDLVAAILLGNLVFEVVNYWGSGNLFAALTNNGKIDRIPSQNLIFSLPKNQA